MKQCRLMFELKKQTDVAFWKTKSKKKGLKRLQSKTMRNINIYIVNEMSKLN